jgi:all-trans-retinol 13,14-reductase
MSYVVDHPAKTLYAQSREPLGSQGLSKKVWDVVFIGSGMGSLAAAAALAKRGKSVLVLEAHTQLGGLTHSFARRNVRWSAGLHYTGWPTAYHNDFPELWENLTQGQAPWVRLPDEGDCYLHPEGRFVKRGSRENYRQDLLERFPGERGVIDRYFHDMQEILRLYLKFMPLQSLPSIAERLGLGWWLGRQYLKFDRMSVARYMDHIGASEGLRDHLWFTWGNFGGVPAETSIGAYAVPMEYLMDGLWTISGGSQTVAEAFSRTITKAGGELRRGAPVSGLLFQGQRVVGVRVGDDAVYGKRVISGIGARETFERLVPQDRRPPHAARIAALPPSCSIMTLYLALKPEALRRFQLNGVNYWVETEPQAMRTCWTDFDLPPKWFVVSLASRFQQEKSSHGLIAAEVFVGLRGQPFERWENTQVMKRGSDYEALKADLTQKILRQVEKTWPGFGASIAFLEAATPLTIRSYTGHAKGAAYGIAPVPGRYSERGLRVMSGIPGLMLTGQDVAAAGVIGAFYGGMAAASAVMKRNISRSICLGT